MDRNAGSGNPPDPDRVAAVVVLSIFTFMTGIWLIIARFAVDYRDTGEGFNGYWNSAVVGAGIAALAVIRFLIPLRSASLSLLIIVLGLWLIAAPFALAYSDGRNALGATVHDMVVGVIVLALATMAWRSRPAANP